jgi:hypothetical protein
MPTAAQSDSEMQQTLGFCLVQLGATLTVASPSMNNIAPAEHARSTATRPDHNLFG